MTMKENGKAKSEKVRSSLLFAFSLLLFTFAANAAVEPPEGYRRIGWIESTKGGGQFINTRFNPTWDTRIVADFDSMTPSQEWGVFFGMTRNDSIKDGILLRYYGNSNDINAWFCSVPNYLDVRFSNFAGKRITAELKMDLITLNGQSAKTSTAFPPYDGPIYLFCGNNGGTPWRHQAMRLYSFKIFHRGVLERDFVPCVEIASDRTGLWDCAKGGFYPNAGKGEFLTDETPAVDYRRVAYIESTMGGGQYIDTEYVPNQTTRVEIDSDPTITSIPDYSRFLQGVVAKVRSFKIYEGENLVHNFVPCAEKPSGNAGLYDVVRRKFYSNKGGDRLRYPDGPDFIGITQANIGDLRTLKNGNTYRFLEDVDISAAEAESAMTVENGARVEIVVPKNVKVNLSGGAASGTTGAGAGIEVPQDATLVIRGAGELFATGGAAANGANGGQGSSGYVSSARPQVESASGGGGGFGGGGAGAGIGGKGGAGGFGGIGGAKVYDSFKNCLKPGNSGANGAPGTKGADCGIIQICETVTVIAHGGVAGTNGVGGAGVDWTPLEHGWWTRAAYGGGGGGGGAGGCSGADIGGGGGGGGGAGGGGSSGLSYFHYNASAIAAMKNGKGGDGGCGDSGSTGGKGEDRCHKMVEYNGSKAETETKDDGNGRGGSGGKGGAAGARGANGTLNMDSTASCTGAGAYDVGKISDTERIRWENGKLWRVTNVEYTEIAYETVNGGTGNLDGGKWYVVKDVVKHSGAIEVGGGGDANLVLLDRAALTADGVWIGNAGILLMSGRSLNVFGVSSGVLTAKGFDDAAGIGCNPGMGTGALAIYGGTVIAQGHNQSAGIGGGYLRDGGPVTINGGTVTANGGWHGAGIGGGAAYRGGGGNGGTVTINGGRVTVRGGAGASGIGGGAGFRGQGGGGGQVTINGGVVTAFGHGDDWLPFGAGENGSPRGSLTLAPHIFKIDHNHYRESQIVSFQLPTGLRLLSAVDENGETLPTMAQDGVVSVLLLSTLHRVTLSFAPQDAGWICAKGDRITVGPIWEDTTIPASDIPQVEENVIAGPVEYLLADGSVASTNGVRRISQTDPLQDALSSGWYIATEGMWVTTLNVRGTVNLILADGATLTVNGGIRVEPGNTLNIFCQSEATGRIVVNGSMNGAVTVNGGRVTAQNDIGGPVTVNCGTVMANGRLNGVPTINGGSVKARACESQPKNAATMPVYCVTVKCTGLEGLVSLEGLEGYGTSCMYPIDGCVYLWLPSGTYQFSLSDGATTCRYCAVVKGRDITVEPLAPVGFFVNGVDIGDKGSGDGWSYQDRVLTLDSPLTYVLSGAATNNEVQVRTDAYGLTVVLSNAVVFTEGRPALVVDAQPSVLARKAALQMAGGTSYLAATNGSAAVSVAPGAVLTVDFAPGANQKESTIGVFNYGPAKAIAGTGIVKVNGGTFFAWADEQAVETPDKFACGAKEAMMTGETPETLRYVEDCDVKPCVLVCPGVTVTVKDIPHVTGFTVSNAVQVIEESATPGAYRVMAGDDIFIGYTVETGYTSKSANPLVYAALDGDIVVDANVIPTLPNIPYRAWNAETRQMEDCVCTDYEVVSSDTATFESNKWYVVTGTVECGSIAVNGAAHLILCDDATLTADALTGGSLAVHGQPSGCGGLKVFGEVSASLSCDGGVLSAKTLAGESLAVVGGTLEADAVSSARKTIDGGSVKVGQTTFVNRANQPLYRVTVTVEGLRVEKLRVEGLKDYGTNDIYAIDDRVYLWLPDGTYRFSLSDGTTTCRYYAEVKGIDVTVEPLPPVGFFVNGVDIGEGPGVGWNYMGKNLMLNGAGPYVLSGVATNDEAHIHVISPNATVILSNAVVFVSENPSALNVDQNTSLLMAGGTSYLAATNNAAAVSVGPQAVLTVGFAPGADEAESMIGVFNYGVQAAIAGAGAVAVNGGTLAVWADNLAASVPLTSAANEVMLTGADPADLRYAVSCGTEPCVLVTPGVAVTVKDIPHVAGFTVSNTVQKIEGTAVTGGTEYRVLPGEDVYAYYTLEEGYFSKSANPLVYTVLESNVTVTADAIQVVPTIPYRAWNETTRQMEDKVCTDYTVVTNATATFEDGGWYVVTDDVSCSTITVNGAAHLILCDDATLTADAMTGGSLAVYGQTENDGALVMSGTVGTALTVVGGNVKAGAVTTRVKNAMGEDVYCVTAEVEELKVEELKVLGLEDYGITDARLMDGRVYLWLPVGTHYFTLSFTLSDETTYYCYCAEVDGADVTVWPTPPPEPVTPGEPSKSYTTAEEATNAAKRAVLVPTDEVVEKLETDEAIRTYCDMFGFAVTGGGVAWFVKATLYPEAWTNVVESASQATRQIPLADIAALPLDTPTNVTATCGVPGFYYSLYDGSALTNIVADANATNLNVLCGADAKVVFPEVKKPSDAAGFFSIGVKETPGITPSDGSLAPIAIKPGATVEVK